MAMVALDYVHPRVSCLGVDEPRTANKKSRVADWSFDVWRLVLDHSSRLFSVQCIDALVLYLAFEKRASAENQIRECQHLRIRHHLHQQKCHQVGCSWLLRRRFSSISRIGWRHYFQPSATNARCGTISKWCYLTLLSVLW